MKNLIKSLFALYLVLFCLLIPANSQQNSTTKVLASANQIGKFETLYLDIYLDMGFTNPYDPDDIRVDMIINSPDNKTITLPCFYEENLIKKTNWAARFTPTMIGQYKYSIKAINKKGELTSKNFTLNVKNSDKKGFVRLNPSSNYSFLFDSGIPYRGVGLNVCWEVEPKWGNETPYNYTQFLNELEKNNSNYIRTWMCPWNLPLEWTRVVTYENFLDELKNFDKIYSHTSGLKLDSGQTTFTEDDLDRIAVTGSSKESIVYNIMDIKKFKAKLFYLKDISEGDIKCYSSPDNINYSPIITEFSLSWNTNGDWQRLFVANIKELPAGTNFLKIEFDDSIKCTPQLGGITIGYGKEVAVLDAPGLGRYYEKTAKNVDNLIKLAEEKGIYIMLTFDYHGVFKPKLDRWGSNDEWRRNPYNVVNGGPCENPEDFFLNPTAKKIYKNRLRYMVARWGYSTNIACWEFWNEVDNVMAQLEVPAASIVSWHAEMAPYLKQIDPYGHLVSTSVVRREMPGLWDIKDLDFTQHHNYGPTNDMKESIVDYLTRFKKPDVVGEFSLGAKGPGKDYPVELYEGEMHRGLWRGVFSPTPLIPMTWWWEWHLEQKHYYHFKMVADFIPLILKDGKAVIQDLPVSCATDKLEVLGLKSGSTLFVWLNNTGKEEIKEATINIESAGNSKFKARYYNTWTGQYAEGIDIVSENGKIHLSNLSVNGERDVVVILDPLNL